VEQAQQLLGEQHAWRREGQPLLVVRDLCRPAVVTRLDDGGVRMAERGHRDAGDQVQVTVAVDVPDVAALAAGEAQRRDAVVAHHRRREALLQR